MVVQRKIEAPLSNHVVRKFSANVQSPRFFRRIARKSAETAFTGNFFIRQLYRKVHIRAVLVILSIFRVTVA